MELLEITIREYHQAVRDRKLTAAELVDFYLNRMDKFDGALNSIICIHPRAREEAQRLDRLFQEQGQWAGPLHGVPVLLKDNIETQDLPVTAGSCSLKDFCSGRDATIVRKLREAGAIILAKTNLHEFAIWGETVSSIKGQTVNPYDRSRTPGGSSGGTGAALAANMGLAGIGTDTVNSIRSPASANSLVGLRPTLGRVSRFGIVPYSLTQDSAGPMARTVEDACRIQNVIQGYDPHDRKTAWSYGQAAELPGQLRKDGLQNKRIGILRAFFGKEAGHEEVNQVMQSALRQFKDAGAILIDIPDRIDSTDLAQNVSVHLYEFRDHLNTYLGGQNSAVRSLQDIIDSGLFHPGIKDNLLAANVLTTNSDLYRKRLQRESETRDWLMNLFAEHKLDGMVYPHQQQLVCKIGNSQQQRNGVLASVTGFPSICIPAGFSSPSQEAPIGVPIGMEILGMPFHEPKLLTMAYSFEQMTDHRKAPQETGWR